LVIRLKAINLRDILHNRIITYSQGVDVQMLIYQSVL